MYLLYIFEFSSNETNCGLNLTNLLGFLVGPPSGWWRKYYELEKLWVSLSNRLGRHHILFIQLFQKSVVFQNLVFIY